MRKLMTVSLVCLWALAVTLPLRADEKSAGKNDTGKRDIQKRETPAEKEKPDATIGGPEARMKSLMQQMEKLQRAMAEESQALAAGDLKEKQQKMAAEMKKMQEEMMRQMQQRGIAFPQPGAFGAPVDPAFHALQQAKMMLQSLESATGAIPGGLGTGEQDPVEIGQKMVIAGLEVQLKVLAARINATEDEDARQKLTAEFREIIEQVVAGRKKLRERTIQQLETRLAELKKNAEKDETADQIAKRLLESAKGGQKASADETPTKEAKKNDARPGK
ncbi:MAG: hypothetical protein ACM3U2_03435 [Deltaproteobacteria bacterium]